MHSSSWDHYFLEPKYLNITVSSTGRKKNTQPAATTLYTKYVHFSQLLSQLNWIEWFSIFQRGSEWLLWSLVQLHQTIRRKKILSWIHKELLLILKISLLSLHFRLHHNGWIVFRIDFWPANNRIKGRDRLQKFIDVKGEMN